MIPTVRGPVPPDSPQYIQRKLDEELLLHVSRLEWVTLFGGRQSGKSSALRRLQARIQAEGGVCAYVDLSPIAHDAEEARFLGEFYGLIRDSLSEPEREPAAAVGVPGAIADLHSYFQELALSFGTRRPIVVVIDEATGVPAQLRTPFFSSLRALYGARVVAETQPCLRDLVFVFAGTFDPNELISSENSPFNVSRELSTSRYDFNEDETSRLVASLGGAIDEPGVLAWTRGHPYLTVQMVLKCADGTPPDEAAEDLIAHDMHLRYLGHRLGTLGDGAVALLNRVRAGERIPLVPGAVATLDSMETIGLIVGDSEGNARVRNKLYERFAERFSATQAAMEAPRSAEAEKVPWSLNNHALAMFALAQEAEHQSPLVTVIFAGVAMEAVLLAALESASVGHPEAVLFNEKLDAREVSASFGRIRAGDNRPEDWTLAQMIEVARLKGLVDKSASTVGHVVRDWRNLVHPAAVRSHYGGDGVPQEDASLALESANYFITKLT